MTRPAETSPVAILALARLLAAGDSGATDKTLGKDLAPLVKHRWEGRDWAERLGDVLDGLESAGAVGRVSKGKAIRFALTEEGRRLASEALGIAKPPGKLTWAKLKADHLPALALGRAGGSGANLKVEVLRSRYGLDLGDGKPSIPRATEALAAKLLGLEAGRKFTADEILRKLLLDAKIAIPPGQKPGPKAIGEALFRRELGDPSARKPLDLLATRSVGARQATAAELASAVLRSWIDRSEAPATPHAPPPPFDLPGFARKVVEAARTSPTGRFGDAKVFISHARQALRDDPAFREMDDASFQGRLVEAHRARLLELGRADLVEAMDPIDVRESATPYLNAVYHFVRIEEPDR
jgi:hypothetical protein